MNIMQALAIFGTSTNVAQIKSVHMNYKENYILGVNFLGKFFSLPCQLGINMIKIKCTVEKDMHNNQRPMQSRISFKINNNSYYVPSNQSLSLEPI